MQEFFAFIDSFSCNIELFNSEPLQDHEVDFVDDRDLSIIIDDFFSTY